MRKISICAPVYNESENIEAFYKAIVSIFSLLKEKYSFELLFVDDGSSDDSLKKIKQLHSQDCRVQYVELSRNYGKEIAMAAGFDYAQGDAVITMDADLQHPPETILEMIDCWEQGYQDVYGKRIDREGESWLKKKCSQWYYSILKRFSKVPVLPGVGDYRLLDRVCIEGIKKLREGQRYTKGLYMWIGYKKKEVSFIARERNAGVTKWNGAALFGLAIDGVISNTLLPLRFSIFLGLAVSLVSFLYMLYVFVTTIFFGTDVPGYPSLAILILLLGGIQLLAIGIIGEYIGKIYMEVKNRPLYLIQKYSGEKSYDSSKEY